ncbi:MAG: hypothetical protein HUU29_11860 [Planctomycetaceae bacterium]|nr:hypothetical protein [Planctomycetaceae bacterium]
MARRMGLAALAMLRSLPLNLVANLGRFTKQCAALALMASAMIARSPEPACAEFGEITTEGEIINVSDEGEDVSNTVVAMDADGDYVVVWEAYADSYGSGIFARRYNSSGEAQGAPFQVNTTESGYQSNPDVAMDADGNFVIVWDSNYVDDSDDGVVMRRYNAAGVAQSGEVLVNTEEEDDQILPKIAMDSDGDFVVTWRSDQDGSGTSVHAQRFDAAGAAQGAEFQVNTFTYANQTRPDVAMNADGDFVIVWESSYQDSDGAGIFMQRYDADGNAQGAETQVNTEESRDQDYPAVAMDADGNFAVVYQSYDFATSDYSVVGQRFDASGAAEGAEFQISASDGDLEYDNSDPRIAMDGDGDFVVVWEASGYPDGSSDYYHILARRYNSSGEAVADETFIRSTGYYDEVETPAVAIDADGSNHVIVWNEYNDDTSGEDVFAQRFTSPVAANEPPATSDPVADAALNSSIAIDLGATTASSGGGGGGGTGQTNFANSKGLQAKLKIRNTRSTPLKIGVIIIKVPKNYHKIKLTNSSITRSSSASSSSASMVEIDVLSVGGRVSEGSEARSFQASAAMSVESDDTHLYIHSVELQAGDAFDFGFAADAVGDASGPATVVLTIKAEGGEVVQELQLSSLSDSSGGCSLGSNGGNRPIIPFAGALLALFGGWFARRRKQQA